ncbi:MAG: HDOD domain-containing protein [Phycisphaeraceae bacterium]|nr:HDOD domain-containing protein [Phycisphaeraceae bacterium]
MTATTPTPTNAFRELDKLLHRIHEVSTLPASVTRIVDVSQSPLSDVNDLAAVIESDPAIAARVLRYANSVVNGLRHPITTLPQAISYLGFSQIRNLAVTASVCKIFQKEVTAGTYSRRGLWKHMASVALTSKMIAEAKGVFNPEEVFLAGLFHDLGIILEDQYLHEQFVEMMTHYPKGRTLVQAEQQTFGFDHTILGYCVARRWRLPELVQAAIRHHHDYRYEGVYAQAIACVELANVLCTSKGISSVGVPLAQMSPSVLNHLKIERHEIRELIDKMNERLDQNQQLLSLPGTKVA